MNGARLVEDRLRAEYVGLLPAMQRTLIALETEVRYVLLPTTLELHRYERILVRGRVKECESAVDSLRRRQEGGTFDADHVDRYSLTALPDLVGVRVLTFPNRRLQEAHRVILAKVSEWSFDPVSGAVEDEEPIALKYQGFWNPTDRFRAEIQIVSLLIGLFWEVEHSAIYKPSPNLRGVAKSIAMRSRTAAVLSALRNFEEEFDRQIEGGFEFPSG
jgi:ppGpp synthetase/RelA/SpoT-type nucleotidyltranferase